MTPEHDRVVRLIIAERLIKSAVLVLVAISLLAAGRLGYLSSLSGELQEQLNLTAGHGLFNRLFTFLLTFVIRYLAHGTLLAIGALLYAALETTEGIGLAFHRRWAEYLTVVATSVLIPFEVVEVVHRVTLFRVGALVVNVAIVVYLAYRKRLFADV